MFLFAFLVAVVRSGEREHASCRTRDLSGAQTTRQTQSYNTAFTMEWVQFTLLSFQQRRLCCHSGVHVNHKKQNSDWIVSFLLEPFCVCLKYNIFFFYFFFHTKRKDDWGKPARRKIAGLWPKKVLFHSPTVGRCSWLMSGLLSSSSSSQTQDPIPASWAWQRGLETVLRLCSFFVPISKGFCTGHVTNWTQRTSCHTFQWDFVCWIRDESKFTSGVNGVERATPGSTLVIWHGRLTGIYIYGTVSRGMVMFSVLHRGSCSPNFVPQTK